MEPKQSSNQSEQEPAIKPAEVVQPTPAAAQPAQPATSPPPVKPASAKPAQPAASLPVQPTQSNTPPVADDVDVIEKEWVDAAQDVVERTAGDPYNEEEGFENLQVDYLKKRYGKDIKKTKE